MQIKPLSPTMSSHPQTLFFGKKRADSVTDRGRSIDIKTADDSFVKKPQRRTQSAPPFPKGIQPANSWSSEANAKWADRLQEIKKRHPKLTLEEAFIQENRSSDKLTKEEMAQFFKHREFSYDAMVKAIVEGNPSVVESMLKVQKQGYSKKDREQFLEHARSVQRDKIKTTVKNLQQHPDQLKKILGSFQTGEMSPEQLHSAALAATPAQIKENPRFLYEMLLFSSEPNWNTVKILTQKGAQLPGKDDRSIIFLGLVRKDKNQNRTLVLENAIKTGLIPNAHHFLCEQAQQAVNGNKYLIRDAIFLLSGLERRHLTQSQNGLSPLSILYEHYKAVPQQQWPQGLKKLLGNFPPEFVVPSKM